MKEELLKQANKALDTAKIGLMTMKNGAFFSSLVLSFKYEWSMEIPTAATDGKKVWINPETYLRLTPGQRISRLTHEVMHPVLDHFDRAGDRNHQRWNVAADHGINWMLVERGFEKIETWQLNPEWKDLTAEQIYDLLPDGASGEGDLHPEGFEQDREKTKEFIDEILVRAEIRSKQEDDAPGTIPGSIQIYLDELLNPKLPWHKILQRYMNQFSKNDYSWKRLNKRYLPIYLPSLISESLGYLAIAMDASGSVNKEQFTNFVSHTARILKDYPGVVIDLVIFDSVIQSVTRIKSVRELLNHKFVGQGGTELAPVMEWIAEKKPQVTLIFTDGEFKSYHLQDPKKPVIWIVHDNPKWSAPFGTLIHQEI